MVRPLVVVAAALVCLAVGAAAQTTSLRPGSRVRITGAAWGSRPVVATVLAIESDTLILKPDAEGAGLVVPLSSVESLELGRWRTHAVEGALLGALTGLLFATIAGPCDEAETGECSLGDLGLALAYELMPEPGRRMATMGGVGLLAGAALGAGFRTEVWRSARRASVSVGMTRRGAAVGLSFSF